MELVPAPVALVTEGGGSNGMLIAHTVNRKIIMASVSYLVLDGNGCFFQCSGSGINNRQGSQIVLSEAICDHWN